jgi:outer membrane protein
MKMMCLSSRNRRLAFEILLALATSSGASAGAAEPPKVRAMTLHDALAYARKYQPSLRAMQARLAAARADRRVARAEWYPVVTGSLQLLAATANNTTASYVGTPGLDVPRVGATKFTSSGSFVPQPSTFAALGASQEVFDFGRIAAQTAVYDALIEVEQHSRDAEELRVAFDVEEAYYAVLAAHAVLRTAEEGYQRARVHRDLARASVSSGLRPAIELTRSEADVARFSVGRIRAQGGVTAARSAFAAAVGVPGLELDVAGPLTPSTELPTLEAALELAARRDPQLLRASAFLESQRAETHALSTLLRPDVALTASFSGREGGAEAATDSPRFGGWLPDVPNWSLGLVFRWRLFDKVLFTRRDASRQRESVLRAELDAVRQQQGAAVQQARLQVQVEQESLAALERAVEAARANYAQAETRFRSGLGTSVELADAEAVRTDSEIQLVLGRFQLARARANFGRLIAEGL